MPEYILSEINIYPVKSLGGIPLPSAFAGERGLQYDRRWMLVDEFNRFITQREFPQMATIGLKIDEAGFSLFRKKHPQTTFNIPFELKQGRHYNVTIFNDVCDAIIYEGEANDWLSEILNSDVRLAYMPEESNRLVDDKYDAGHNKVSFADGYPFLILGEASLKDLNTRLEAPVPMNRFRPNFVFSGGQPYDEDNWKEFKLGNATFNTVKKCSRCIITTTDQNTGERFKEPLRTLSIYRKEGNNVWFGQNLIVKKHGVVRINDQILLNQ